MPDTAAPKQSETLIPVRPEIAAGAHVDAATYRAMVTAEAADPEAFWANEASRLTWMTPPTTIKNVSFTGDVTIRWYEDGVLNASVQCLDRHLPARRSRRRSCGKATTRPRARASPTPTCMSASAASPTPCKPSA